MISLYELPDDPTPAQFKQLDRPSLDMIDFTLKLWRCQCKGCENGTKVRDYGVHPLYFLQRNSKRSHADPTRYWRNIAHLFWLCSKHWKRYLQMGERYGFEAVYRHLLDKDFSIDRKLKTL